jgi:hypothetical protein
LSNENVGFRRLTLEHSTRRKKAGRRPRHAVALRRYLDFDLLGLGLLTQRESDRENAGLVLRVDLTRVDRPPQRERPRERAITPLDAMELLLRDFRVELSFAAQRKQPGQQIDEEPGLRAFLQDPSLRGNATADEIEFLKKLRFTRHRPTPLYYYRELQNLRDPLHFRRAHGG